MWELIRANKRNSIILLGLMAVVLMLLGFFIGSAFGGGLFGVIIAVGIWAVLCMVSFSSGDSILLMASKAVPVTHDVHPQLFNVVEEMTIAANLGKMPKVYIINDPAPNAFATGRNPQSASVAVTAGLLAKLNRDELQGVMAHEISHIINRDILFVTLAGIMLGAIVLVSQVFLRSMFYSSMYSRRRYSSGGKGGGQAQMIMMVVAIVCAILAPLFAYLLYFALSRRREYLADAGAARLTRYPEGLASALEKIAGDSSPQLATVNKVTAPMYIANPFKKKNARKLNDLTSTHPPISERVKILRNMMHGAAFKDYEKSYESVTKSKQAVLPKAALKEDPIGIRGAGGSGKSQAGKKNQMRQVGDIVRMVNQFVFINCVCGLILKVPPNFKAKQVKCPRCGEISEVKKKKA